MNSVWCLRIVRAGLVMLENSSFYLKVTDGTERLEQQEQRPHIITKGNSPPYVQVIGKLKSLSQFSFIHACFVTLVCLCAISWTRGHGISIGKIFLLRSNCDIWSPSGRMAWIWIRCPWKRNNLVKRLWTWNLSQTARSSHYFSELHSHPRWRTTHWKHIWWYKRLPQFLS